MKKFNRIITLLSIIGVFTTACNNEDVAETSASEPPNILLIIADDFGLDACPNYDIGGVKPAMPHLEALMNGGITFDNCWAAPMCSPTRASILTGKHGVSTGVLNASDASTIGANELTLQAYIDRQLGKKYSHSIIGKWHLSIDEPNRPNEMGIDYYAGLLGGGVSDYNQWKLTIDGETNISTEYITTKLTNLAIDWINDQDESWFCWLGYNVPHTPFHLPPTHMHSQGTLPTDQAEIENNPLPYYMAMVESMDYEIGRLLDAIPQDELENTVILFIGDNGTAAEVIQSPYLSNRSKGSLYQGGVAVPLVVWGKGVDRKGVRDQRLINSTDLFATIAQIAGIDTPQHEDGYSFYSALKSETESDRVYNYAEILNPSEVRSGYTIRDARYKLMVLDSGSERFYDLINDPYEEQNIINSMSATEEDAYNNMKIEANRIRE